MTWSSASQPPSTSAKSQATAVQQPPLDLLSSDPSAANGSLGAAPPPQPGGWGRWQNLNLRTKVTLLAIALGVVPVIGIGAVAYSFADRSIVEQITQEKQDRVSGVASGLNGFMSDRYGDVQVLAQLPILANPKVRAIVSDQDKQAILDQFIKSYGVYDSIAVADLAGRTILQSTGEVVTGLGERDYFKAVKETGRPVITPPRQSALTGGYAIFLAAPVFDAGSKRMVAVVRSRIPVEFVEEIVKNFASAGDDFHVVGQDGKFFIAWRKDHLGKTANSHFANFAKLKAGNTVASQIDIHNADKAVQLVTYAPLPQVARIPKLNWEVVFGSDTKITFAPQRQLLLTLAVGTGLTAVLVSLIAAYLATRLTRPIEEATAAVEQLGQGELDTRLTVTGADEFSVLGSNINRMAEQIQTLIQGQEQATREQLAIQTEASRQQTELAEQQKQAKEKLQQRALELLIQVDPVSRGDLTVRASVTEDEIGTVADSYNATVGSLRKLVDQVQQAASQVASTTSSSEVSVQELSTEALRQAEDIAAALDRIEEMSISIRMVAASAEQAEAAVQEANQTVQAGDLAMNRTVEGILAIRETVTETAQKVKRLGESSEKISQVVNLISTFAAQTNLLALNASMEAARAGEEGRGFAVVANEVRNLARQSAKATVEIEKLVAEIQAGTNEVVAAMEAGTEQVATGTQLVDETRQSLNKIASASDRINDLVEAIAKATVSQAQASEVVTQTMTAVAEVANKTSTGATQVSASFKDLLTVAQELQTSVGQFKVS